MHNEYCVTIKGMVRKLLPAQLLSVAFTLLQQSGIEGIALHGHSMGVGKTTTALATMLIQRKLNMMWRDITQKPNKHFGVAKGQESSSLRDLFKYRQEIHDTNYYHNHHCRCHLLIRQGSQWSSYCEHRTTLMKPSSSGKIFINGMPLMALHRLTETAQGVVRWAKSSRILNSRPRHLAMMPSSILTTVVDGFARSEIRIGQNSIWGTRRNPHPTTQPTHVTKITATKTTITPI
ncbi:uncharacterized protein BP5553_10072 [Venustampulla echinocandica]|uniref:Uncharacterized protein n=1 Tax=Venustampulla echinocandica TaxID=2656787 RepID=A0A370TA82_9HELO|nr:uncharacterized protein BP5553_10072 [Venustampulla echinocandica]RDL30727.1 hypothetical protein BP5553_10072 [Venustampulla echinocandica]